MSDRGWYAVYTEVRSEKRAETSIKDLGFRVFAPTVRAIVRHARRRKIVDRPLLPRYIFAQFAFTDALWPDITRADGVEAIMSSRTTTEDGDVYRYPVRIPDRQMARIMDWEQHEDIIAACKAGDIMRVIAGPFAGHVAMIVKVVPEKYRASGDIALFGRTVPTEFDIDNLERP